MYQEPAKPNSRFLGFENEKFPASDRPSWLGKH